MKPSDTGTRRSRWKTCWKGLLCRQPPTSMLSSALNINSRLHGQRLASVSTLGLGQSASCICPFGEMKGNLNVVLLRRGYSRRTPRAKFGSTFKTSPKSVCLAVRTVPAKKLRDSKCDGSLKSSLYLNEQGSQ